MKILLLFLFVNLCFILAFLPTRINAQDLVSTLFPDSDVFITAFGENDYFFWVGTNKGVYKINKRNGKRTHYTQKNSRLPHNYVTAIACSPNGQTYIGTINGILMWDNYAFLLISTENSNIPENIITALAIDRSGHLWIGTYNEGLVECTGDDIKPFRTQPIEFNNESIYSITFDPCGHIWVVFFNGNLACLRDGEWNTFSSNQSPVSIQVGCNGRFSLNTPGPDTYVSEESTFKNLTIPSACTTKTYGYYNRDYSRFLLCHKEGVFVLNINSPFEEPVQMSTLAFFKSLQYNLYNKKSKYPDRKIPYGKNEKAILRTLLMIK